MVLFSGKLFHKENALPAVSFHLRLAMTTKYRVFGCFFFFLPYGHYYYFTISGSLQGSTLQLE